LRRRAETHAVEGQVQGGIVQGGVEKLDIPFTPSRVWEALATKA